MKDSHLLRCESLTLHFALCGMSDSCLKDVHFSNQYPEQFQEIVAILHFMKLLQTDSGWSCTTCCVAKSSRTDAMVSSLSKQQTL